MEPGILIGILESASHVRNLGPDLETSELNPGTEYPSADLGNENPALGTVYPNPGTWYPFVDLGSEDPDPGTRYPDEGITNGIRILESGTRM